MSRLRLLLMGSAQAAEVSRGAYRSAVITGLGMALGLITQLILTRALGDEDYGVYAYAMGWVTTLVMLSTFDFGVTGVRFVGAYVGAGRWGSVRAYIREIGLIVLALTLMISAVAVVLLLRNQDRFAPDHLSAYLLACALLPVAAFLSWFGFLFQGLKEIVLAQAPNQLLRPLIVIVFLSALWVLSPWLLSPLIAVGGNLVASVVAVGVSIGLLRRAIARGGPDRIGGSEFALWMRTSAGLLMVSLSQLILAGKIDVLVVGTVLGPTEAGLYTIALLMSSASRLAPESVSFASTPMISEVYANGSTSDLQRLLSNVYKQQLLFTLPVLAGVALTGRGLLVLMFGAEFGAAYPVLLVVLGTQLLAVLLGWSSGNVVSMTGHEKSAAWMVGISAVIYLVLVGPLTAAWGPVGTATATLVAALSRSVQLVVFIRLRLGVHVVPFLARTRRP